jgi:hypothetical protein
MLGTQIPVAIPYATLVHTVFEQSAPIMQKCPANLPDEFPSFTVKKSIYKRFYLSEILLHVEGNHFRIAIMVNFGTAVTPGIELGQMPAKPLHIITCDSLLPQKLHQACPIRQSPHFDGVFHRLSGIEVEPPRLVPANAHNFLIYSSGEALIKEDFPLTEMASGVKVAKIEKPEIHGLLQLVNPISDKKDRRDVSFPEINPVNGMGIKGGLGHGLANVLEDLKTLHDS